MSEQMTPSPPAPKAGGRGKRSFVPFVMIGLILVCVVVALIVGLALRPRILPSRSTTTGFPLEISRVPSTGPTPDLPPSAPVVEVGDTAISLGIPVTLQIGDRSFPISPVSGEGGAWLEGASSPGAAVWVYGTVVNYVVGIEPTPDIQTRLDQLSVDDELYLRLSNGVRLTFVVTQREEILEADGPTIFAQYRPGMTLILLGEAEPWEALFADLSDAEEIAPQPGDSAVGLGQAVQVGDGRVTVEDGYVASGVADLPPGTLAYMVDISIENTGASSLDVAAFVMELVDGVGNRYLPSSALSAEGRYGPLDREIAPNQRVTGTVGYLVPEVMEGPELLLVFGPHSSSELRAYFVIPYTPTVGGPAWPEVYDVEAFLDASQDFLHVVATVENTGASPLEVRGEDIALSSNAGPGELQLAAPPLPWIIPAGESRVVELQFVRPAASSAVVTILGYTFEISGLP